MALITYVRSARDDAVADEALVDVYVVDEFIPKGADATTIRASVSVEQIPARLKQSGAITDLAAVGDEVAATDMQPGDQLLGARLGSREGIVTEVTDKVQVALLLEPERAVGGVLRRGDLVGVYLSFEPFDTEQAGLPGQPTTIELSASPLSGDVPGATAKTPNTTRMEFRHVLVTNVQTTDAPIGAADDGDAVIGQVSGRQYVVTLALSPEQSERLVFAAEFGTVRLALDPATVGDDGTRPVTLSDVYVLAQ
jgi:pilus assembly protein CpaB